MDQSEAGSVSRSVALPPKMWELIDRVAKDSYRNNRSSYIRELISIDVTEKDGQVISGVAQGKGLMRRSDSPVAFDHLVGELADAIAPRIIAALSGGQKSPGISVKPKPSIHSPSGKKTGEKIA